MNSKLLDGLQSLTSAEQELFDVFLRSPYQNSRKRSLRCWAFFQQYAPNFSAEDISMEKLGNYLFPDQAFHRQAVLDEISHLYRLLKSFWEYEGLKANPLLQRSLRLRQLSERRLDRLYQVERKAAQKLLQQTRADREIQYQYELAWASIDNEQFGRQQMRTVDAGLASKLHALDVYYLTLLLRESCEALNRQHILNTSYEFPLLPAIIGLLAAEDHPYRRVPVVDVYYQIYLSLQDSAAEREYEFLLASLRSYRNEFSMAEYRAMYKYAQNFCIRKINGGHSAFDLRLFELFQELLAEGIIFIQDKIAHTDYKNITTIGLRVKAHDWVAEFLEQYKQQIDPSFRDNVYAYCRASWALEMGQSQQAIRLLQSISHTDVHYQISARQLLLKIYYYEQDYETVLYTIDAFRHFLQRNRELPKARKEYHLRFLTRFKALCLLRERLPTYTIQEAKERLAKAQAKLDASDDLANRSWLLEEIAGLQAQLAD